MGYPVANEQLHRGYIQSWNLIVEHKLPGEIVTSVGYVGSASVNGFAFLDINASQIPGSGDEGRPLFAKFGRTATTREWDGRTHSIYHSLQATLNRRVSGGLFLKGAYTYSQAIDEADYGDWTEFSWNAPSVFYRNRASRRTTSPTCSSLAIVYELPFGNGKKWATERRRQGGAGRLADQRHLQRLPGTAVHADASGASLNMPGNRRPRTRSSRRSKSWARSVTMAPASTPAHLRGSRRSGSATSAGTPCAGPAW